MDQRILDVIPQSAKIRLNLVGGPPGMWQHDSHCHIQLGGVVVPSVPAQMSCDNQFVVGKNAIISPIKNAAGNDVGRPVKCRGSFWINTTESNWQSYCDTGWELL
jgi:hypothetical protein